jgi:DNA gyrase/topoisomerase IV subunit A
MFREGEKMTSEYVKLTKEEIEKLISLHSPREEIDILIEEMSELTKALLKQRRRRNGIFPNHGITREVCEEFVHVHISMAVLGNIMHSDPDANLWRRTINQHSDEKAKEIRELIK